jgi:hypothetical protein
MCEHKDKLILVCTLQKIEGHLDLGLLNLFLDMS